MRKKMNEFLNFDCMWHMCGCCWLKVVVVIAGLKMPGGGCVPLIPYLISRSRGEALNPKHTHTLTHSLANTHAHMHIHTQPPTKTHKHIHMFSDLLVNCMHTKFWNSQQSVKLFAHASNNALYIIHKSLEHMCSKHLHINVFNVTKFDLNSQMHFYLFVFLDGLSLMTMFMQDSFNWSSLICLHTQTSMPHMVLCKSV